jgi:hypothetical protein
VYDVTGGKAAGFIIGQYQDEILGCDFIEQIANLVHSDTNIFFTSVVLARLRPDNRTQRKLDQQIYCTTWRNLQHDKN